MELLFAGRAEALWRSAQGVNMSKKMARLSATIPTGRPFRGRVKARAKRRADRAFIAIVAALLPLMAAFGAAFLW